MPARAPRRSARLAALATLLVLAVSLAGCGATPTEPVGQGIQGTGDAFSDLRDLAPFTRVSIAMGIKVIIGEAAAQSVEVKAQQNLLPAIETVVRDGQLMVNLAEPVNATVPMTITIRMTSVDSVAVSSGAVAYLEHTGGPLNLDVSAGAELTAIGTTTALTLTSSSGSHAKLGQLTAEAAQVDVNDGSSAELSVTGPLTGRADGGSTITLTRTPASVDVETLSGATIQGG